MKTKLILMFLMLYVSNIYSQKAKADKWRSSENDTMMVAHAMFDDQNFIMAYPYLNQLQKNHPADNLLKYMTGISSLFSKETQAQGLSLLLDVYKENPNAEDIEYYIALAYHYNGNFDAALEIVDKYLARKKLSKPQIRVATSLKEYCQKGEKMVPPADEGKMDDYVKLDLSKEE